MLFGKENFHQNCSRLLNSSREIQVLPMYDELTKTTSPANKSARRFWRKK